MMSREGLGDKPLVSAISRPDNIQHTIVSINIRTQTQTLTGVPCQ
jgi:hypothetical protein